MKLPRIYISAAHKSSGKTTLSLGLCRALSERGKSVQPFKKGPDYIDSLWLGAASQRRCYNIDFNTMTTQEINDIMAIKASGADIAIIEGNKGLYDGLALDGSTSNAAMATLTKSPVVLVIDAQGVTRGVAPLLLGYQAFDCDINIAGVIFNKVGGQRHQSKLISVTEHYTDIPVLGCVQRSDDMLLTERHLGLMPYNEMSRANNLISGIAKNISDQVDIPALLTIAETAPNLVSPSTVLSAKAFSHLKIALFKDSSFGFYYEDDLDAFIQAGVELIFIDALNDKVLPKVDGIFIGGGFPETKIQELSVNTAMRTALHQAIEAGMPVYAECGGLMYLSESISWNGETKPMVGVIPAPIVLSKKPQGRGYVKLTVTDAMPWYVETTNTIAGHEFHYSQLIDPEQKLLQKGAFAYDVERGYGIDGKHDGWVYKNLLASYAHMRDTQQFHWVTHFLQFIKNQAKA